MGNRMTMDGMEALLLDWAAWLTVGDGSGYARLSVLHEDWSPPTPGQTPTMKTSSPTRARRVHAAISGLSVRLRDTLVMHYIVKLPRAEQAARLGCQPDTIRTRITMAKRLLMAELSGTNAK